MEIFKENKLRIAEKGENFGLNTHDEILLLEMDKDGKIIHLEILDTILSSSRDINRLKKALNKALKFEFRNEDGDLIECPQDPHDFYEVMEDE